jgi:hypothetical protein
MAQAFYVAWATSASKMLALRFLHIFSIEINVFVQSLFLLIFLKIIAVNGHPFLRVE